MGRWNDSEFGKSKRRREFLLIGIAGGAGLLALSALGVAKKGGGGSGPGTGTSPKIPYWATSTTLGDSQSQYIVADPSISPTSNNAVLLGNASLGWKKIYIGSGGYISDHADGSELGAPADIAINSPVGGSGMAIGFNVGGDMDINANAGRVALISGALDVFVDGVQIAMYPVGPLAAADSVALGVLTANNHWRGIHLTGSFGVSGYDANSTNKLFVLNAGSGLGLYATAGDTEFAVNLFASGANGSLRFGPGGATPPDVFVERNSGNLRFLAGGNRILWDGTAFQPATDNARDLGTSAFRWRSLYLSGASLHILGVASDANDTTTLKSGELDFGPGGASAVDVKLVRNSGSLDLTLSATGKAFEPTSSQNYDLGATGAVWRSIYGHGSIIWDTDLAINTGAGAVYNSGTDGSNDLGLTSKRWRNIYCTGMNNVSGDFTLTVGANLNITFGGGSAVYPGGTDNSGDLGLSSRRWRDLYLGRNLIMSNIVSKYNGITTAGFGVPAIVAEGDSTGNTGAISSVCAYTVGASNGVFKVGGDIDITAFTSGTVLLQVTYTDWNSGVQTITIDSATLLADTLGNEVTLMAKASTSITIKTTGTFTATYSVAATITQYK